MTNYQGVGRRRGGGGGASSKVGGTERPDGDHRGHQCLQEDKPGFSSVQLLSHVRLFATTWTAALQASLSITNSRSSLKLMSIESVMPSNHLILYLPLLLPPSIFPASGSFQMSQLFLSGGQSIRVSASASVPPVNTQD